MRQSEATEKPGTAMLIRSLQFLSDFSVDHPYWTTILCVLITAYICKWLKSSGRTPPGPYGFPLVGYLPFLMKDEYLELTKLREIYGKIYSIKLGILPAIVVSDFKALKEALNKDEVTDRPPEALAFSRDVQHLGDMELKTWKESRRFMLSTLRTLGMGKNKLEEVVNEEVQRVLDHLSQTTGRSEFNVHNILYPAINNIIISLVCGKKLKDDSAFSASLDSFSKNLLLYLRVITLLCYMPFLKYILPAVYPNLRKTTEELDKMERFIWKEIYSHEEDFDETSLDNYMDHFIAEMRKGPRLSFNKPALNGNSQLLLMAGNDTTLSTIEWALLHLAQHQDLQERVYQEVIATVGKERPPCWDDREYLPYLDAFLAESSRFKTIVPLADPHWTTENVTIGNYDIPKGTVVIPNLHAIHFDPDLWQDPEQFNPDRFLTPDGKRAKDPEFLIPFSIGKRLCPGEKLAKVEVFLFVGAIIQKYKILPPSSGLNFDSQFDLVVHPVSPFIKTQARN